MKSLILFTILAAAALSAQTNDDFSMGKFDEYLFRFLEGMNLHLKYENSVICKEATSNIKNEILTDATLIINNSGQFDRAGVIALANTVSIIPDFLRHCDGTFSFIFEMLADHFSKFDSMAELQTSFTNHLSLEFFELASLWTQLKTHFNDGEWLEFF